jgi:hypothetical protein
MIVRLVGVKDWAEWSSFGQCAAAACFSGAQVEAGAKVASRKNAKVSADT